MALPTEAGRNSTPAVPEPPIPNQAKRFEREANKLDVTAVVPATQEPFGAWLDRRYSTIIATLPSYGKAFALDLASSTVSDEELDALLKGLALPKPLAEGLSADEKARQLYIDPTGQLYQNAQQKAAQTVHLPGLYEQMPNLRKTAAERALKMTAGKRDPEVVQEAIGADPDFADVYTFNDLVDRLAYLIGQTTLEKRELYSATTEEIKKSYEAVIPQTVAGSVGHFAAAYSEGLEGIYRSVSRPVATAENVHQRLLRGDVKGALDVKQRWNEAVAFGPGRSIAFNMGLKPGTAAFKGTSATLDAVSRIVLDPINLVGGVGKGAKLAERVIAGTAKEAPAQLGPISRLVFEKFATSTPEEFVRLGRVSGVIDRMWSTVQAHGDNLYAFMDRFQIPREFAEDILAAKSRDELEEVVVDGMYGRLTQRSVAAKEAELTRIAERVDELEGGLKAGTAEKDIAETELRGLKSARKEIAESLLEDKSPVVIRALEDGPMNRVKQAIKRPENEGIGKALRFFSRDNWTEEWTRNLLPATGKIPSGGIPLAPEFRAEAAADFEKVAKAFGLKRSEIDQYASRFARASSDQEAYEAYVDMLRAGGERFPEAVRKTITQFGMGGTEVPYAVFEKRTLSTWSAPGINGIPYNKPLFPHQTARILPLPDIDRVLELRGYTGRFKQFLKGQGKSALSEKIGTSAFGVQRAGFRVASAIQAVQDVARVYTSAFWKPAVLITRLGWPMRVVPEEMLRLFAVGAYSMEDSPFGFLLRVTANEAVDMDVPEEALAQFGRYVGERVSGQRRLITVGEKQYAEHLGTLLSTYRSDPVVQVLVNEGPEEAANWLRFGKGREYLDNHRFILDDVLPGKSEHEQVAAWVAEMNNAVNEVIGKSPQLQEALKTGFITFKDTKVGVKSIRKGGKVHVSDHLEDVLKTVPQNELPAVIPYQPYITQYGTNKAEKMASTLFEWLGSKPSNWLNRRPAYKFFYRREFDRLTGLGIDAEVARTTAEHYAVRQVGNILYDATERTATDYAMRNIAPFFPAWKEVLKRWLVTIPAQEGMGIGHAVIARKMSVLFGALKDDGVVVQNSEGEWEIRAKGLSNALSSWLGVEGIEAGFPLKSFNMLGSLPGIGPVPTIALSKFVKDAGKYQPLVDALWPYGLDPNQGPAGLTRALKGLGIDPPWNMFNRDRQNQMQANAVVDVARTRFADLQAIAAMPAQTDAERKAKERAYTEFWRDSQRKAMSVMFRRGLLGMVTPVSPHLYWPNQEEANKMRELMEHLDETTGKALFREWLDQDPSRQLMFVAKTHTIDGEKQKEFSFQKYLAEIDQGERVALGPDWPQVAVGYITYADIRNRERAALSELGPTFKDWLVNEDSKGRNLVEIRNEARESLERLKQENPVWFKVWEDKIRDAARRDGKPIPTLDEEIARDGATALSQFAAMDIFDREAKSDLKRYAQVLRENYNLERFFTGNTEATPESEEAEFYDKTDSYWTKVDEIHQKYLTDAENPVKEARGYYELQKLRNSTTGPVINGVQYPHPEEAAYLRLDDEQKEARRRQWAQGRVEWLAPFQREILGLPESENAQTFWGAVSENAITVREFIAQKGWSPSSREARAINGAFDSWKGQLADYYGTSDEFDISQKPAYARMQEWKLVQDSTFTRIAQLADGANAVLASAGKGIKSKIGGQVLAQFAQQLDAYRRSNPQANRLMTQLQASSPNRAGTKYDTRQDFYTFFFFQEG